MMRATQVLGQYRWSEAPSDTVVLDFDDRHRRRMAMTGTRGLEFLLDLENAVALRGGVDEVAQIAELSRFDIRRARGSRGQLAQIELQRGVVGQFLQSAELPREPVVDGGGTGVGDEAQADPPVGQVPVTLQIEVGKDQPQAAEHQRDQDRHAGEDGFARGGGQIQRGSP